MQLAEFAARGQIAEPEQVAGLFKIRVIGQFVNVDTAVGEDALITVDVTDPRIRGNNSFESFSGLCGSHAGHSPFNIVNDSLPDHAKRGAGSATFSYT